MKKFNQGILLSSLGSFWWGVIGVIYFRSLSFVGPHELVIHRCLWTTIFLLITSFIFFKVDKIKDILKSKKKILTLLMSSILILTNWSVWIYAVTTNQIINASFGYFIMPIMSVFFGYLFFKERLNFKITLSIILVIISIIYMFYEFKSVPLIGLTVAISWSLYNVCRKLILVDTDIGLLIESLFIFPFALIALLYLFSLGANMRIGKNSNLSDGFGIHFGINIGRIIVNVSQDFSSGNLSSFRTSELTLEYVFSDEPEKKEANVDSTTVLVDTLDSDGDGVIDIEDECPNIFGSLSAKGCPDTDGDGVEDKDDICPNTQGFNTINGCPILSRKDSIVLNSAIRNLYFDSDSEKIKPSSHQSLNEMSKLLLANKNMILIIHGHTDSDASNKYNLNLSARRAKSVRDFILKRGVTNKKVIMDWFGEENPLFPNTTELNKSKNRRVEFSITFM